MYLPFQCNKCSRDKWSVIYDTETKTHKLACANCGLTTILEDIMSGRTPKVVQTRKPAITQANGVNPNVAVQ